MTARQPRAPQSQPFGAEAFERHGRTELRWLGMAGFLINARGTTLMVDPLLGDFDMPVLIDFPIGADSVPHLDAVLITHSEWHFGLDGAIPMANAYPRTPLLLHHWGCVDAPDFPPFNADPASLPDRVVNPDRIIVLAPGEPYTRHPLTN